MLSFAAPSRACLPGLLGVALLLVVSLCPPQARAEPGAPVPVNEPTNTLERRLLEVQRGEREIASFVEYLIDSEVVVLSKRDVLAQRTPEDISALVLPGGDDNNRALALFTSPERAQRVAESYPEYRYGMTTEFLWVLAHTSPGLGLAINPGWTLGLRIPSFGVLQMRDVYEQRIQAHLD